MNIAEEKFGIKVEQFMRKKDSAVVDDDETLEDLILDAEKKDEELWLIALTTDTTILAKTELAPEIQDIKTQKRQHNRLVEIFANLKVLITG